MKRSALEKQRLLTLVVGGREVQVRLRNLNVVTEDIVVADLQRSDSRALAFAGFDLGDVLPAVLAKVAEFVEFRVVPRANGCCVAEVYRRRIGQRGNDGARGLRNGIEPFERIGQPGRRAALRQAGPDSASLGV